MQLKMLSNNSNSNNNNDNDMSSVMDLGLDGMKSSSRTKLNSLWKGPFLINKKNKYLPRGYSSAKGILNLNLLKFFFGCVYFNILLSVFKSITKWFINHNQSQCLIRGKFRFTICSQSETLVKSVLTPDSPNETPPVHVFRWPRSSLCDWLPVNHQLHPEHGTIRKHRRKHPLLAHFHRNIWAVSLSFTDTYQWWMTVNVIMLFLTAASPLLILQRDI